MTFDTERPEGATGEGTADSPWFPDVHVQLSGNDGNAFAVMGAVKGSLRRAGAPADVLSRYTRESMAGDYDDLIQTAMRWVEVG